MNTHNKKQQLRRGKTALVAVALATLAGAVALVATLGARTTIEEPRRSPLGGVGPGMRRVFALDLETKVFTAEGQAGHYKIAGQWIVEAGAERGRVLTFVEGASITSDFGQPGQEAAMAATARELAAPIELAVDGGGLITEVRENPRATLQVRAMLKAVAAYSQFADAPRGAAWTGEERDGTGTYRAAYTRLGAGRFTREKQAYTSLSHTSEGLADEVDTRLDVEGSRHEFHFAPDGHLTELSVVETLGARGKLVDGLATQTTMTLRFVAEEPVVRTAATGRDALEVVDRPRAPGDLDFSPEADAQRLAGRHFSEVVAVLEALPEAADRSDEDRRTARVGFIALGAALRLDDANVAEALALINDGSPLRRTLWDALAQAGTPAAQAALREVIGMPDWSTGERRSQMIGLSLVKSPTDETVAFLHGRFADAEQGIQARYGLGTAIYHLQGRRPEAAEAAFRLVVGELGRETLPANQAALIVALGNSAYPAALAVVRPYLGHKDPALRHAAIRGMRQQPGAQVDAALIERALEDSDESVRLGAVDVLGTRPATTATVEALARIADEDGASSVRKRAATALSELAHRQPELAAQLAARGR